MTNNRIEIPRIFASKDTVDALRLDASSITPRIERRIAQAVPEITKVIADEYYPFIPPETLEKAKTISERFVITDKDTFEMIQRTWDKKQKKTQFDGVFLFHGDILVVQDPASLDYIWDLMSGDMQQSWLGAYGTLAEARKSVGQQRCGYILIHEIIHAFHSKKGELSLGFIENGVSYYTRETANKLGIVNLSPGAEWEANIYQSFLKQHGQHVHGVFFGSESDADKIAIVNDEYTRHVMERLDLAEKIGSKAFDD